MLPDRVGGEMQERRNNVEFYSCFCCRFELTSKALALAIVIIPAVVEQLSRRFRTMHIRHSTNLRNAPSDSNGYLPDTDAEGQSVALRLLGKSVPASSSTIQRKHGGADPPL